MCCIHLGLGQQRHILETDLNYYYTELEINKCRGLNEPVILKYYSFHIQELRITWTVTTKLRAVCKHFCVQFNNMPRQS